MNTITIIHPFATTMKSILMSDWDIPDTLCKYVIDKGRKIAKPKF